MNKLLISLLNNKKRYLETFESLSYQLLNSEIEALNDIFDQREAIIEKINFLDNEINRTVNSVENKDDYLDCLKPNNIVSIKPNLNDVYEAFQLNYDSLLNIQSLEKTINQHLKSLKEELSQNLAEVQNVSKIKKYFETFETEINDLSDISQKTTKI